EGLVIRSLPARKTPWTKAEKMDHSKTRYSRRKFLSTAVAAPVISSQVLALMETPREASPSIIEVNFRKLLDRADLKYDRPVIRSEEGLPVGNGRMGSLVWTSPDALKFQVNRVDVYGNDSHTNSFIERHSDYCGGCGFVDIELGDLGEDIFLSEGFSARLSVYDGFLNLSGNGITAQVLAWPERDVLAVEINDRRQTPEPININLRMLRFASQYFGQELETFVANHIVTVQTRHHRAVSQL